MRSSGPPLQIENENLHLRLKKTLQTVFVLCRIGISLPHGEHCGERIRGQKVMRPGGWAAMTSIGLQGSEVRGQGGASAALSDARIKASNSGTDTLWRFGLDPRCFALFDADLYCSKPERL